MEAGQYRNPDLVAVFQPRPQTEGQRPVSVRWYLWQYS